jgi:hypothetical protein
MMRDISRIAEVTASDKRRGYQATDKVSLDIALRAIATIASGLVEICAELQKG